MRPSLPIILLFISIYSCSPQQPKPAPQQETPKALTEDSKSDYSFTSKRGSADLVDEIYQEEVGKSALLQNLEKKIANIPDDKADSLQSFEGFDSKNTSYYHSATEKANSISDSLLKKKMLELIATSETGYESQISEISTVLKNLDEKSFRLKDYHTILKLKLTLPIIQKYQKANRPPVKPLQQVSKEYDRIIKTTDSISSNY